MKKQFVLSADETLIRQARQRAIDENTTLDQLFQEWLIGYVGQLDAPDNYQALMARLDYIEPGRHFSRKEMNERH